MEEEVKASQYILTIAVLLSRPHKLPSQFSPSKIWGDSGRLMRGSGASAEFEDEDDYGLAKGSKLVCCTQ
jgi:hypothetical protein